MKLTNLAFILGTSLMVAGIAHAAPEHPNNVSKKITLTAQINDGIFVSKPDGSTWYSTEELEADDYRQKHFSKTLPIRVWTRNADFNISLAQPLKMSSGNYEMLNPTVVLQTSQGDKDITVGQPEKVTQTVATDEGYDSVYNLKVSVDEPKKQGELSLNGSYSGDLVMLFEPVASAPSPEEGS